MVDTTTTPSASVASRDVALSPFSTTPVPASIMTDLRNQAASPNWTPRQGHVEPLPPVVWSVLPSQLSPLSVTGYRGCSPAKPLVPPPLCQGGTPCWQSPSTQASTLSRKSSSTSKSPEQESMLTLPKKPSTQKIVPSASIDEYNRSISACPGSVYSLRVRF